MTEFLIRPNLADPTLPVVSLAPGTDGWQYVGFEVVRLPAGEERLFAGDGREQCLVVLTGTVNARVGEQAFDDLGGRKDVFDGRPAAVYAPPGADLAVSAASDCELALGWAEAVAEDAPPAYAVKPGDIELETRGAGLTERFVHPIVMGDRPAQRLLVVEVITPGGHWSSFPPHKHDVDDLPRESLLWEVYYHRIKPERGFAVQRVYSDDRELDETVTIHDRDTVLVPRGYHPVGAVPGYDLYYLNVMVGPARSWVFANDPDHEWLVR